MTETTTAAKEIEYHPKWGGYANLPPVPGWFGKNYWARATSLAKVLDDTYNLTQWKLRQVALGIKMEPTVLDLISDRVKPDSKAGKEILNAVAARALEVSGSHDGADRGTALHDLAEELDATGMVPVGADVLQAQTLVAYSNGLRREGIEILPEYTERVVVCPSLGVAGRLDRIVRDQDGDLKIGDLKSQKWEPGAYDSMALSIQLAIYANATHILDHESWTWEAMPKVSRKEGLIFWIPSTKPGAFEIYDVDLVQGAKFARAAKALKEWRYQNLTVTKR